MYKVQLHPAAAPLYLERREDVDTAIAFYKRLAGRKCTIAPGFPNAGKITRCGVIDLPPHFIHPKRTAEGVPVGALTVASLSDALLFAYIDPTTGKKAHFTREEEDRLLALFGTEEDREKVEAGRRMRVAW